MSKYSLMFSQLTENCIPWTGEQEPVVDEKLNKQLKLVLHNSKNQGTDQTEIDHFLNILFSFLFSGAKHSAITHTCNQPLLSMASFWHMKYDKRFLVWMWISPFETARDECLPKHLRILDQVIFSPANATIKTGKYKFKPSYQFELVVVGLLCILLFKRIYSYNSTYEI